MTTQNELNQLQKFAEIGKRFKNVDLEHMDSPMSAYNYIRIADIIANHIKDHPAKILDWGAGYGQLSWLLQNRGINVIGHNIEKREHISEMPLLEKIPMIYHSDPVKLPFEDEFFDGIISCGVLEHVSDPVASLREIHRVLKPEGYFYIFMLPQKTSWVEKLSEWRGISVHPVRYTFRSVKKLFGENGFSTEQLWKFNLFPKNLTGLPRKIKQFYGRFYKLVYPLDFIFSKIPWLNLLSGVIEGIARKK